MSEDEAALRKVCEEFSQAIHEPNEKEREQLRLLLEECSMPTLLAAIREAAGKGRSCAYIKAILRAWKEHPSQTGNTTESASFDLQAYEDASMRELMEL